MADEHEFNPIVGMALAAMDSVSSAQETDNIKPIPSQFSLGPGDVAVLASSISSTDESLTVAKVLNAEDHAEEYPDWADRLQQSFLLCHYHESGPFGSPEGFRGWISRVKLIQLPNEHYEEILGYIKNNAFPKSPPPWLSETYDKFNVELAQTSPETVPSPIKCPNCGLFRIGLVIMHSVDIITHVGVLKRDGKEILAPVDDWSHTCNNSAKLVCGNCAYSAPVSIDSIIRGSDSALQSILNHH